MSKHHADEVHYPVTCPACGSTRAMLWSATPVAGYSEIIRVEIRCAACAHDWTLHTRHSDPRFRTDR
jgi:C4-type Zn-finger protein